MWETIQNAFNMVKDGTVKRVDGDTFTVYKAGNIIRIDVKIN